jgi:hypothetical protein
VSDYRLLGASIFFYYVIKTKIGSISWTRIQQTPVPFGSTFSFRIDIRQVFYTGSSYRNLRCSSGFGKEEFHSIITIETVK